MECLRPTISLVAANYNGADYITEFIDSVIAQTYTNWELIIIDDGSSDSSISIAEAYSKIDNRIKLIKRDKLPKGACTCRNIGLELAKGKYIIFPDADDILPEYCLETRLREIEGNPTVDFIVFPAITFMSTPYDSCSLVLGIEIFKDDLSMFLKRYRLPFAVWTNIYRKDYFFRYNIRWDEQLKSMQDSDLNIMGLSNGAKYEYSKDKRPSYFWRTGGNQSSITKTIKSYKNLESQFYFFEKLQRMFAITKYDRDVKRFGLTILNRALQLKHSTIPQSLLYSETISLKTKLMKYIYTKIDVHSDKLSYIIFAIFYPLQFLDELYNRVNIVLKNRNYFRHNKYNKN